MTSKTAPTHAKNADLTPQKLRFVEWLFAEQRIPSRQGDLAIELGVDPATLSDWKRDDPLVAGALGKIEDRISAVDLAQFRIATDIKHPGSTQAATYLAKRFGMFKAEKVNVEVVDRVAYVDPGALRERSIALYPELKN